MAGMGDNQPNAEGRGGSSDGSHAANPTDVRVPSLKRYVFVLKFLGLKIPGFVPEVF